MLGAVMGCWVQRWDSGCSGGMLGAVVGCCACSKRVAPPSLEIFSFSGDTEDPAGRGPLQPAVGDPASAGGWTR